jgi:hypothetical protein
MNLALRVGSLIISGQAFQPELLRGCGQHTPGHDFVRVLEDQVDQCDVLLVIVGKDWISAQDDARRNVARLTMLPMIGSDPKPTD